MTGRWVRKSFAGRGSRTAHLTTGVGRQTACGTHLGYGNVVSAESDAYGRCKRCTAAAEKLAASAS